jgi:prophage antirepressor-like protein
MKNKPAFFEDHAIRRIYDEKTEIWWFCIIDMIQLCRLGRGTKPNKLPIYAA